MKVAQVFHFYEKGLSGAEMVEKYFSIRFNAESLVQLGIDVHVFFRFHSDDKVKRDGVHYHFIKDSLSPTPKKWNACRKYNKAVTGLVQEKGIKLIHAHNPFSALCHQHLQKLNTGLAYLVQDHSGLIKLKNEKLLKLFLKNIDGLLFSAPGMEDPWIASNILTQEQVYAVMEASCEWRLDPKLIQGYEPNNVPRFLWIGNLDKNKDPLTVLKAMASYKTEHRDFRLQMIFRENTLEAEVRKFIEENELTQQVDLIAYVPRERISLYMHQNDYFIAASHKEGSGYSLMEAMACGLTPIATRIPSFVELTQNEKVGSLYPVGDDAALLKILNKLPKTKKTLKERMLVVDFFNKFFSYEAIAKKTQKIYHEAISRKKSS